MRLKSMHGSSSLATPGALLIGHAVVIRRDEQLRVALKADDAELPDGHEPPPRRVADNQRLGKRGGDEIRDAALLNIGGDEALRVHQLAVQTDGVDGVDHRRGQIVNARLCRGSVGREGFHAALAAEEHHALVEHRKPRALLSGGEGLAGDAVKIRAVDRVISPIEADRLDIHIYVKELRRPWANAQGVFYVGL